MQVTKVSNCHAVRLFGFAIALLFANAVLHGTGLLVETNKNALRFASLGLLVLFGAVNFRAIRFSLVGLAVIAISSIAFVAGRADALNILMVVLMGINARALPKRDLTRCLAMASSVAIALLFVLHLTGVISDKTVLSYYAGGGDRLRHTLGFANPNAATLVCSGALLIPLAFGSKRWQWAACGLFLVTICRYTGTRSILYYLVFMYALSFVSRGMIHSGREKLLAICAVLLAVVTMLSTMVLPLLVDTSLDYLLSYRPSIVSSLISGLTIGKLLFGESSSVAIDNSYLLLFVSGGIIVVLMMALCMVKSIWKASLAGDYSAVAFLVATVVLGLFESFLFRPELARCSGFWSYAFLYSDPNRALDAADKTSHVSGGHA